ncbi:DUF4190 domain-containing protein [Actinoplanes sp. HUAS TT8]|uniref:DUF4190 domain-containing protein n=1 Tax=Actinoplanes sp. HUAS TT8 TaxID=3447453 RepID=UPI003F528097
MDHHDHGHGHHHHTPDPPMPSSDSWSSAPGSWAPSTGGAADSSPAPAAAIPDPWTAPPETGSSVSGSSTDDAEAPSTWSPATGWPAEPANSATPAYVNSAPTDPPFEASGAGTFAKTTPLANAEPSAAAASQGGAALGIVALVLAGVSLFLVLCDFGVSALAAVVVGVIHLRRTGRGQPGRRPAVAAIVIGALLLVPSVVLSIGFYFVSFGP